MDNDHISGGAFQIARKMFKSELWLNKPSTWKVIWVYILGKVNHTQRNGFARGEGFFQWKREIDSVGTDITPDMIKKFMRFARDSSMIRTERSTRGMIIKVLKYDIYQTLTSYGSTDKSTRKAPEKHPDTQELKNDKNVENTSRFAAKEKPKYNPLGIPILDAFKEVDPKNGTYYGNTTQRKACDFLLKEYGLDKVLMAVKIIPKINEQKLYIQQITTPYELMNNWVKLGNAVRKSAKLKSENIMW